MTCIFYQLLHRLSVICIRADRVLDAASTSDRLQASAGTQNNPGSEALKYRAALTDPNTPKRMVKELKSGYSSSER
jgi:hypothetical protein